MNRFSVLCLMTSFLGQSALADQKIRADVERYVQGMNEYAKSRSVDLSFVVDWDSFPKTLPENGGVVFSKLDGIFGEACYELSKESLKELRDALYKKTKKILFKNDSSLSKSEFKLAVTEGALVFRFNVSEFGKDEPVSAATGKRFRTEFSRVVME
jgi:hypothetical protein